MSWIITGTQKEPPSPYLLDTFPAAAAAYSLRQLRTGNTNVVRVRRSSDNAEQDFTATEVSDGTLASWVGAGNNGFVRILYDQSGNGLHLGQTTTANQPGIVGSGALITEGVRVCLDFDGTNDQLNTASEIPLPSPLGSNVISVFRLTQGIDANFRTVYELANIQRCAFQDTNLGGLAFAGWPDAGTTTIAPTQYVTHTTLRQLLSVSYDGGNPSVASNYSVRRNSQDLIISQGNTASGLGRTAGLSIGSRNNASQLTALKFQEMIVYPETQSANIAAIEANINAHYNIF